MNSSSVRIAKRMAEAGLCSRRAAEQWILDGRVQVNGHLITTPAIVVGPEDEILVDGTLIPVQDKIRLWLYHKPVGLITSHQDPEGRRTVFESLPKTMPRVISVGRLDMHSEGLLLLTNNGDLARFLEHPSSAIPRTYRVRLYGDAPPGMIRYLKRGVSVEGVHYGPIKAFFDEEPSGTNKWLTLILKEGKNREIRRLMQFFDLTINRLLRVSYGPFELQFLKPGEVFEVPSEYVQKALKKLRYSTSL